MLPDDMETVEEELMTMLKDLCAYRSAPKNEAPQGGRQVGVEMETVEFTIAISVVSFKSE